MMKSNFDRNVQKGKFKRPKFVSPDFKRSSDFNPNSQGRVVTIIGAEANYVPKEWVPPMIDFAAKLFCKYEDKFVPAEGCLYREFFAKLGPLSLSSVKSDDLRYFFPGREGMLRGENNPLQAHIAREETAERAIAEGQKTHEHRVREVRETAALLWQFKDGVTLLKKLVEDQGNLGPGAKERILRLLSSKTDELLRAPGPSDGCSRCGQKNHKPTQCYFSELLPVEKVENGKLQRRFDYQPAPALTQANRMEWVSHYTSIGGYKINKSPGFWFASRANFNASALMQTLQLEDFCRTNSTDFAVSDGAVAVVEIQNGKVIKRIECGNASIDEVDSWLKPSSSEDPLPDTVPRNVERAHEETQSQTFDEDPARPLFATQSLLRLFQDHLTAEPLKPEHMTNHEWLQALGRRKQYYTKVRGDLQKRLAYLRDVKDKCVVDREGESRENQFVDQ